MILGEQVNEMVSQEISGANQTVFNLTKNSKYSVFNSLHDNLLPFFKGPQQQLQLQLQELLSKLLFQ